MILLAFAILFNSLVGLLADEGCALFTFGKCDPNSDLIIGTQTIPCSGLDLEVCADVCQNLCKFTAGCNFFSFHSTSNECVLMQEDQLTGYIASCSLVSGPSSPSLPLCSAGALAPCDVFINEDCDYEGNIIFSSENVVSSTDCQALLSEIGQTFGAHLFIHDVEDDNSCQFLDSSSFKCSTISGPADPPILDCSSDGTTTSQPVSTTTYSTATTTLEQETTTNPVATTVQLFIYSFKHFTINNYLQILGNVTVYVDVAGKLYETVTDSYGHANISIEGHLPFSFNFVGVKEGYHQYSGCHHLDGEWMDAARIGMFLQDPPILDCPSDGTTSQPVSTTTYSTATTTYSTASTTLEQETTTNPVATTVQLFIFSFKHFTINNHLHYLGNVTVYVDVAGKLYETVTDSYGHANISIEGHLPFSFNFVGVKEGYHQYSGCHHLNSESWFATIAMFLQHN